MEFSYGLGNGNKVERVNKFKRVLLFILISLTLLQQMPIIKDLFYNQIRLVLYVMFGVFSAISLLKINRYIKFRFVKYLIFTIVYSLLLIVIQRLLGKNLQETLDLIIPFGILICSLNTSFNNRELGKILVWYVLLSAILGISSIFYYGQGFTITRTYFLGSKNQIGPILGISAVITGIWTVSKSQFYLKYNSYVVRFVLFTLLILSIITIRNRSSLLSIFIVGLLALFREYKFKRNIKNALLFQFIILLLIALIIFGVFNGVYDFIFKSIFYNYDVTDLNSISAGRTDVYKMALKFSFTHPVLGELGKGRFINSTPHNYVLNKWVKYGIVGSLPLIIFYVYLWLFTLKKLKRKNSTNNFTLPLWILLFSLIVSLFEYTYPYGPGVSQLIVWFLLGQYFKRTPG